VGRDGQATAFQLQGQAELHLRGPLGKRARHVSSSLLDRSSYFSDWGVHVASIGVKESYLRQVCEPGNHGEQEQQVLVLQL
jgi:hypothetical protein